MSLAVPSGRPSLGPIRIGAAIRRSQVLDSRHIVLGGPIRGCHRPAMPSTVPCQLRTDGTAGGSRDGACGGGCSPTRPPPRPRRCEPVPRARARLGEHRNAARVVLSTVTIASTATRVVGATQQRAHAWGCALRAHAPSAADPSCDLGDDARDDAASAASTRTHDSSSSEPLSSSS